jgi:gliding motility-associated-like protein
MFWGQEPPSAIRLSANQHVTNAIIFENSGYKPLSGSVFGYFSASDSVIIGEDNIYPIENPFTTMFRIDEQSPAFNRGTTEGLRPSDTLDLDGNPRVSCCGMDIGAFEFYELQTRIIQQPRDIRTVYGAKPVFLSVVAEGTNLNYQWQFDDLDLFEQTSETLNLGGKWEDEGIYQVMVYGVCCNDTSRKVSVIYDDWTLESGGECPDEDGWATFSHEGEAYSYNLQFTIGTGSTTHTPNSITGNRLETGRYQIVVRDSENRTLVIDSFFTKYLPIKLLDSIVANPDNVTCDNGLIQIDLENPSLYHFDWYHDGELFSHSQDLNNAPIGHYKLHIERKDFRRCESDTFNFLITACDYQFRLRNAYISPNGDGINDFLWIDDIEHEDYRNNTVTIINSYGETIYKTTNYKNIDRKYGGNAWDGRNRRGHLVPDGVYYYVVEIKGMKTMAGWVMVKISD